MSTLIFENMVLQYVEEDFEDNEIAKKIRVIYIEPSNTYVYFIRIGPDTSMPKAIKLEQLEIDLEVGAIREVPDSYLRIINEEEIPEKHKKKRNKEWKIVQYLWNTEEKLILFKNERAKSIQQAVEHFGISEIKVKRIISRFWQRGMTKNSLLSDYRNQGGKGKIRKATGKKRGRPRKTEYKGESGINADESIRKIFDIVIKTYYEKKQKPSLMDTYRYMMEKFFSYKYTIGDRQEVIVWDQGNIPSYHQFYYWFRRMKDYKKNYISRFGEKSYLLNKRELLGDSTMEVYGPGSRYQIDATVADVYLVSSINRNKIIGRPVVYGVIDVYSRLMVGIYAGLEGPSWIGAMMALDNVLCDKVEFCEQYDIKITKEQWPQSFLPEAILADRGEFEGYQVENLINNLNIKVENTAPYRGDLKPIIERHFRTTNEKIKHMVPGAIQKEFRERGDRDYRLDATLTLKEFVQIYIYEVLYHNQHVMQKYPMEKQLVAENIPPVPNQVWSWGIKNRKGRFNSFPIDIVRLNLFPRTKASISRTGIKLKNLFYSTEKAIQEQWFINQNKKWIEIAYDPRNMNNIYIPTEDGRSFDKCFLLEKSFMYKDLCLDEIIFQQELKEEMINEYKNKDNQIIVDTNRNINRIVDNAKEKSKRESLPQSARHKINNIRKNKAEEKIRNREEEKFELEEKKIKEGTVIDINKDNDFSNVMVDSSSQRRWSLLRQKRDEEIGGNK